MTVAEAVAESHLRLLAFRYGREADPLGSYRWHVPRLREAFGLLSGADPVSELVLRACNKGGKTLAKAMFMVACAQKRRELDGCPIPQWRGPVEGLQLVLDYPQQLLSVKPAYLRALGAWPSHVVTDGEYLKSIRVMPLGGDPKNESEWSVIHFLTQKNLDTGRGARADLVDFDEPPKMDFLDELRKAGHAGRRSIRIIGFTPLKRREWAPIRDDYGDMPRSRIRRVDRYRAECRWSLHEVADWVLSAEEKDELISGWSRRSLKDAREHGDYENTEASSPWGEGGAATLEAMRAEWCRNPELRRVPIVLEDADGRPRSTEHISVQVWTPPKVGVTAYQCIDPASGQDDGRHNPLCLHLSNDVTGELMARWNGYIAPYSLGSAAAALHRHYHNAATDIEMKDHWGVNVLRGYQDADGGNLCYERRELRRDIWSKEIGFDVTGETRAIWVGCIQEWIAAFAGGVPFAPCPSREVFDCLLDMELDDRDMPVAGPGIAHGEDFVLTGQRLRRLIRPRKGEDDYLKPAFDAHRAQLRTFFGDTGPPSVGRRPMRPLPTRPL